MRRLVSASGWLISMVAFVVGGMVVLSASGKYNLKQHAINNMAENGQYPDVITAASMEKEGRSEDQVRSIGSNYQYKDDILTFLLMVIDRQEGKDTSKETARVGALFLFVLDTSQRIITLIPVDPNTITGVNLYDEKGTLVNTITTQISRQYEFGDGKKKSCEYQVKAVEKLIYGLPVNGYLAIDIDGISQVSEMIGGIDTEAVMEFRRGNWQHWAELISRLKQLTKKDGTLPVKIYTKIADKIVTDITVDEAAYLAAKIGGYYFDTGQVVTIPGTNVSGIGNNGSEDNAFYIDEAAFHKLVLDIFYEPED